MRNFGVDTRGMIKDSSRPEMTKYLQESLVVLERSMREANPYDVFVLGRRFIVLPGVFSPKYFNDTEFFARNIPIESGDAFLEIGCGTGIISIFALLKGASRVTCLDRCELALNNTIENMKLHIKNFNGTMRIAESDVYSYLGEADKYDKIFWNVPFGYIDEVELPSVILMCEDGKYYATYSVIPELALFDPGYRSIRKFINGASDHLVPGGKLLIGFSSTLGRIELLESLLADACFTWKIIAGTEAREGELAVRFELIEAKNNDHNR